MVKNSPNASLTDSQPTTTQFQPQVQEAQSCPNFASKVCLQIEYTPAHEDHFKTPITKAIKKDPKFKSTGKTLFKAH